MKKLQKLFKSKGFTLVECVVAIAVFAVLTLMVLMIISLAEQTSKNASQSETDLNNLVQNVVQDETNKKYGIDSRTLAMKFGSTNFTVTYSVVDGYKNYVVCPDSTCKYTDSNLEFMTHDVESDTSGSTYNTDIATYLAAVAANNATQINNWEWVKTARPSHWFNPTTMNYVCPKCGKTWKEDKLICESCPNEGSVTDVLPNGVQKFIFDSGTGSFTCGLCGSGSVKEDGIDEVITGDSKLFVSGMSANAIRYGKIEEPKDEDAKDYISVSGVEDTCTPQVTIDYKKSSNSSIPGTYKVSVNYLTPVSGGKSSMSFVLPGSYIVTVLKTSSSIDGTAGKGKVTVNQSTNLNNPLKTASIDVSDVTGSDFEFEFTLTNYMNNATFDYDYSDKASGSACALVKYWYKSGNKTFNLPRTDLAATPAPVPGP